MTQPAAYQRAFNFSNFQAQNPSKPLPAGSVDEELSRIKSVIDQIRTSIGYLQRDDFALANQTVGFDQLRPEIEIGVNPPATWATNTNYVARDAVFYQQKFYICAVSHVSGTFADDLAAGDWTLVADFTAAQAASLVTYDNSTSGIAAENLQDAVDEIAGSINVSSVFGRAGAVIAAAGDYSAEQVSFDPAGLNYTDATDVAGALADHEGAIAAQGVPTGTVLDFAGSTAPAGYLMCFGQTVSRTTYAALFAVVGTAHGAGDGATTFGLPDARGRTVAGKDNMGGAAANRLTGFSGGVDGATLGAGGGSEKHTLTASQMATHTHGAGSLGTSAAGAHGHALRMAVTDQDSLHSKTTGGLVMATDFVSNYGPNTGGAGDSPGQQIAATGDHAHGVTGSTASAGSDLAHNNVQPTLVLNKIIKT